MNEKQVKSQPLQDSANLVWHQAQTHCFSFS